MSLKETVCRLRRPILTVAAMAFAAALTANAQVHYKPHMSVGGHAGMAMSQMSFSPSVPQGWENGMTMGVIFRYAEEKHFGVIGELNVTQRGWKESFDDNPGLEYSRSLTYIELPLMTHIYFGPRRCKFFFNAGPQFGYMIGDKISSNFNYRNPSEAGLAAHRRVNQMSMEVKHKFDYGICAGLGMEYYIRPRHSLTIEGRFYYGLGNIYSATKADEFSASRGYGIQIMLGYNFRLR